MNTQNTQNQDKQIADHQKELLKTKIEQLKAIVTTFTLSLRGTLDVYNEFVKIRNRFSYKDFKINMTFKSQISFYRNIVLSKMDEVSKLETQLQSL